MKTETTKKGSEIPQPTTVITNSPAKTEEVLKIPEGIDKDLLYSLRRSTCFGQCPAFKVEIFKDGRVEYYGTAYVKRLKRHEATANTAFLKQIQEKAIAIQYLKLNDKYPINNAEIKDLPKTTTYVRIGNEGKMIINNYDAPKELLEFERWFEAQLDNLAWKEIKD